MPAQWVAASVRAKLLARRRLGGARASAIAASGSLAEALQMLEDSPFGDDLEPGMSLEAAQRTIAATTLWHLRLLAGWLPPGGSTVLQPLAAWFEIANIEERLAYLGGASRPEPYQLGRMGPAWPAVSRATTVEAVREALAASHWGDPGPGDADSIPLTLRFRWAAWTGGSVPGATGWAATASILLAARVLFHPSRASIPAETARPYGLGARWRDAGSPAGLRAMLPRSLSWVLDGVDEAADLWLAETRWWRRVKKDSAEMLVRSQFGPGVVVGAAALLAHDAWLARAALAAAARGAPTKRVFDAVA